MRRDEIAKLILIHILTHPQSKDTFEGILDWWIRLQNLNLRAAEVKGSLDWLIVSDILVETRINNSKMIYSVNQEKLPRIRELFFYTP
jgi:hypothetical protein